MQLYSTPPLSPTRRPYALMCRTSSLGQQRDGTIQAQIDDWRLFCSRNGIDFDVDVHYFLDDGVSGEINIWERPAGAKLKEWIEAGRITKTVYTMNADRVNREDVRSMSDLIELCHDYDLNYATVKDGVNTAAPGGEMWAEIKAQVSREENRTRVERFASGKRRLARNGEWIASVTPFGVRRKPDRTLEADPYQAAIILEWKRLIEEESYSLRKLAAYSTREKHISGSGTTVWSQAKVRHYLSNPAVYGDAHYNKTRSVKRKKKTVRMPRADDELIIVKVKPPIMTRVEWERMWDILKRNAATYARNGTTTERTMLVCLHCAGCGLRYYPSRHSRTYKDGTQYYSYDYRHDWNKPDVAKACTNAKQVAVHKVDESVWGYVVEALSDPRKWRETLEQSASTKTTDGATLIKERYDTAQAQLEELDNRYWTRRQLTPEQYDKQLPRLQAELQAAERAWKAQQTVTDQQARRRERIDTLTATIEQYRAILATATHAEKQEICKELLRRVDYDSATGEYTVEWAL